VNWLSFGCDLAIYVYIPLTIPHLASGEVLIEKTEDVRFTIVAQTECSAVFVLTVACALMYHREVRFFLFPEEIYGRLLKLVDRTDLGSVGASHESSSLSPPTWIKITGIASFVW
jgi:hypothetical protein